MSPVRRRVFVPQALGSEEFLRATWHREKQVVVVSQWDGDECVAAIPVRVDELGGLAGLFVDALGSAVTSAEVRAPSADAALIGVPRSWEPPIAADRVA